MIKIKKIGINIIFCYAILFLALVIFTFLSLNRIKQSVSEDELWLLLSAETLYTKGTLKQFFVYEDTTPYSHHPHLYLYILGLAFRFFGISEVNARFVGIISGLVAIIMVFFITKSLSGGDQSERIRLATLVSTLYALAPTTIQGTAIIYFDNTILTPSVLFLLWSIIKYFQNKNLIWAVVICFTMSLSLWERISTPLILVFLIIFYILISKNTFKTKLISISAIISGVFLFVLSWYLYCRIKGALFFEPFNYTLEAFRGIYSELTLFGILQNVLYLTLWFGFFSLLVVIITVFKKFKYLFIDFRAYINNILLFCGVILILVYSFCRGPSFGFPRYHTPAIPLIYIGVAIALTKKDFVNLHLNKIIIIATIVFIIQTVIVGDLLYVFRYTLRESIGFMSSISVQEIFKNAAFKIIISSLIYIILFLIYSRFSFNNIVGLLITFSIGLNIGTSFLQSTANYNTGYNYGGQGITEAIRYIRHRVPAQSTVLAPSEVIYYINLPNSKYLHDAFWTDTSQIKRRLQDPNTSALVYSIVTNSIAQIKIISQDKSIQEFLHRKFDYSKIGSFVIWIRKREQFS